MNRELIKRLGDSRKRLAESLNHAWRPKKEAEEGGCGVVGFCCSEPVPGKHIYEPSRQMHNRGNGKGGGIAAVGLVPEQLGVSREVLDSHYLLHLAFIDTQVRPEIEAQFITPHFDVATTGQLDQIQDWKSVPGLEVLPPEVSRYFVRVKPKALDAFIARHHLEGLDRGEAEDEFVNQNSFSLNQKYYASLGEKRAFVLSHGRDLMILKVVGFAEAIVKYYKIEDLCAHEWIAHQRFPTKGRVWHPGGAHPFAAIDMALVHNGDFANYHSVCEYLKQRQIYPQFLTDTEVSALLFDLLSRTYHYPLEYIIEALAPTTELDFDRLAAQKQKLYRAIQATHIHGSPDGPWFFIIARTLARKRQFQLMGITDTAMLRPQVFAFCDGEVQVGLIASEKQAIDATLLSLSNDDKRICPVADRYWNARGGSHNDGGAFVFDLQKDSAGQMRITCADKFGKPVPLPGGTEPCDFSRELALPSESEASVGTMAIERFAVAASRQSAAGSDEPVGTILNEPFVPGNSLAVFDKLRGLVPQWTFDQFRLACRQITLQAKEPSRTATAIEVLTLLNDRRYSTGAKKRSHVLHVIHGELNRLFGNLPNLASKDSGKSPFRLIDFETREHLRQPQEHETTLVIDAAHFPPEGNDCDAALLVDAFMKGWRHFIGFNCIGQRYVGCGLGPETDEVTIDVYGSSGDYLASGIDGLAITVHGNAQDQLGQIIKKGKLVIHGDVGQTFMYGAKGGCVYVLGNAAGRPLINSVGRPKVVINGTCLDFLAESFMAGDPHNGGGFVVLNGVKFDDDGQLVPLPEPYPGSNLFSLASGGAIFLRDPHRTLVEQQLNGGKFARLTGADWDLIRPHLEENQRLFGITIEQLLTDKGRKRKPAQIYRKVLPGNAPAIAAEETEDVEAGVVEMAATAIS
ncbi:MAG: glutamate synthase [Verrucomicrobiota bacterium]|jgi:glutamate synthase domain-containing protein 1/glutamate synthase domain-containing protein 3